MAQDVVVEKNAGEDAPVGEDSVDSVAAPVAAPRRPAHRPPLYMDHTPESFERHLLGLCDAVEASDKPLSLERLVVQLGICRETWNAWKDGEGENGRFSDAIKKAEARVHQWWTDRLVQQACVGAIFYAKAALKYRDQERQDVVILGGDAAGARNDFAQLLESSRPAKPADPDAARH